MYWVSLTRNFAIGTSRANSLTLPSDRMVDSTLGTTSSIHNPIAQRKESIRVTQTPRSDMQDSWTGRWNQLVSAQVSLRTRMPVGHWGPAGTLCCHEEIFKSQEQRAFILPSHSSSYKHVTEEETDAQRGRMIAQGHTANQCQCWMRAQASWSPSRGTCHILYRLGI